MNNYNIKSTFIRKRNNNYNVYIEYIDENGKTKQKSQGSYKTKKDADRHLIEIKSSINNNKVIIAKNITIVDRCLKYIEDNYKDASPHTVLNRKSWIKNNIQTFFEGTLLGDVSPSQVQLFLNGLFDKYTVESSKVRYGFLRGVLAEAYRLREIPENPCNFVKMPNKKDTFEGDVYTKEEMQNLIESLKGSVLEAPILLMGLLGLRYSEACGLRWSDVDFENNIININQIIIYQGSAGTFFKEPKTNKSKRSLHAPGELMQILKKERNNQNKLKLQGILENKHDLVCLNTFFNPWSNNTITHFFERFLKKNNIRKIRLHDLRHTNATLMLLSGTNIKIVSDRLGHTDIKISMNKYSHVLEEMDQQASNNLSNILFK